MSDPLQLESEEDYIRARALPARTADGADSTCEDAVAEETRFEGERRFQRAAHLEIFGADPETSSDLPNGLSKIPEANTLTLLSSDGGSFDRNLRALAATSPLVLGLTNWSSSPPLGPSSLPLTLTLNLPFPSSAVSTYLSLLLLLPLSLSSPSHLAAVTSETLVPTLRLSHYLQSAGALSFLTSLATLSVTSSNCSSFLLLADQLSLPSLFEASLTLYSQSASSNASLAQEGWDDFPEELKRAAEAMGRAAGSSVLGRGERAGVFFSSKEEVRGRRGEGEGGRE